MAGTWSAEVQAGAILKAASLGYSPVEFVATGAPLLVVYMDERAMDLDPVVITPDRPEKQDSGLWMAVLAFAAWMDEKRG